MNFAPLWTAMVWPTMSGVTVERRDQVFTTRLTLASLRAATLAARWSSTKQPFLTECSMLLLPPPHDHRGGALVAAGLVALGGLAPGRHRVTAAGGFALAAAHRVVDRGHHHAAVVGAGAAVAEAPGLAPRKHLG